MVAAGLDTIPGNLVMALAYLSSPHGQEIQKRAYKEIMKIYPDGNAWEKCLIEEKVPYITAFVKEVLRFWSVIPICLPRTSIKDINWEGATIPAGTTFHMVSPASKSAILVESLTVLRLMTIYLIQNAWAANYDPAHFKDPQSFLPERYLDVPEAAGTPHYGYGAGSRMCAGSHLANRELYTAFIRIISAFEIHPPKDPKDQPILDALECNDVKTGLTTDPKKFKVGFKARDKGKLEKWIMGSEERTAEL